MEDGKFRCPRCGEIKRISDKLKSGNHCKTCENTYHRERRKLRLSSGLCVQCSSPIRKSSSSRYCDRCRESHNAWFKERRSGDLCQECGIRKCKPGTRRCVKCHERRQKNRKQRSLSIKSSLIKSMSGGKCSQCGLEDSCIAVYEFHHTNEKKEGTVSKWISTGYSMDKILKEAENCIVLCANCHRKIHYCEDQNAYTTS